MQPVRYSNSGMRTVEILERKDVTISLQAKKYNLT